MNHEPEVVLETFNTAALKSLLGKSTVQTSSETVSTVCVCVCVWTYFPVSFDVSQCFVENWTFKIINCGNSENQISPFPVAYVVYLCCC